MLLAAMLTAAALDAAPDPQTATAPAAPAAQAEPAKPEMICRMEEVVGTRFKKKVCMTADEWKLENIHNERLERLRHPPMNGGSMR